MAILRTNLIANFAGAIWTALLGLLLVPLYIRLLGPEQYGLVGVYLTLQAMLVIADLGLSTTLNREIARLSATSGSEQEMRDLVFTLEIVYWAGALLLAGMLMVAAPWLATNWLNATALGDATVVRSLRLMAVVIGLQFPFALYSGGILGLQRHTLLNAVNASWGTIRGAGAVLALITFSPTITTYFTWQCVSVAGHTVTAGAILWRTLSSTNLRRTARLPLLRRLAGFAATMAVIAALGVLLANIDKIVLSRALSLESFGFYTIANSAAAALLIVFGPVVASVFPRFSQLHSAGDREELRRVFHRSSQVLAVVVFPMAATLALFRREVLFAWTRDGAVTTAAAAPLALLALGYAVAAVNQVPHALQVSVGWLRLPLIQNLAAIAVLLPLAAAAAQRYGAAGAAGAWLCINACYVASSSAVMFRKIVPGEGWKWWRDSVILPLFGAAAATWVLRLVIPRGLSPAESLGAVIVAAAASFATSVLVTPYARELLFEWLPRVTRLRQGRHDE